MTDPNGHPGCLSDCVESVPMLSRASSVRARSAYVGSGAVEGGREDACWVMQGAVWSTESFSDSRSPGPNARCTSIAAPMTCLVTSVSSVPLWFIRPPEAPSDCTSWQEFYREWQPQRHRDTDENEA